MRITVDELWKSVGGNSQPKVSVASTLQTSKHLLTVCMLINNRDQMKEKFSLFYKITMQVCLHTQMRTLHEEAEASN